eukprot:1028315-Rhodomonas_salina.2
MPTTIVILVAKWVSDAFGRDGIYDELILLHDYPYLNNKMEFVFNETAADVMKSRDLCVINATGNNLGSIHNMLSTTEYRSVSRPLLNGSEPTVDRPLAKTVSVALVCATTPAQHDMTRARRCQPFETGDARWFRRC